MDRRSIVVALALVAPLSACDSAEEPAECLAAPSVTPGDTVVTFAVNGEVLVSSPSDLLILRTNTFRNDLTLAVLFNEGPNLERALNLYIPEFTGVGSYHVGGPEGPGAIAAARYWCPLAGGATRMFASTGEGVDTLWVTSYDTSSGFLEGEFRFHAQVWRGEGGSVEITDGRFRGMVEKVGETGEGDVAELRP